MLHQAPVQAVVMCCSTPWMRVVWFSKDAMLGEDANVDGYQLYGYVCNADVLCELMQPCSWCPRHVWH